MLVRSKVWNAIYGVLFLIAGIVFMVPENNQADSLAILFLFIGGLNLVSLAYKTLTTSDPEKSNEYWFMHIFEKAKLGNILYGLFFLIFASVLIIRKKGTVDLMGQCSLFLGAIEMITIAFKAVQKNMQEQDG